MAAKPNVPNIQKSDSNYQGPTPPAQIIENKPASSLATALANSKKQVGQANTR
jgi:hypothetical protein